MDNDRKSLLAHLNRTQITQKAIEDLEKAGEALRAFMDGNKSAENNPVRQQHLESIARRLAIAHGEIAEIEQLIDELGRIGELPRRHRRLARLSPRSSRQAMRFDAFSGIHCT